MIRKRLYKIIFEHDTKPGKLFDVVLLWLILISVIVVITESIPEIHQSVYHIFRAIEWTLTILFSIEYLLRIWSSPKPLKYIFSFWGIVDFLSILPTYLDLFFTGYHYLLNVRIFRLLRVFRILRLVRFNKEARFLLDAIKGSSYKIGVFLMAIFAMVTLMGTLMYVVEDGKNGFTSIPQSIYWAIVTITTVGFGDIVPQTILGKFVAAISMIIGFSIIAVPTGIITAEIAKTQTKIKNCSSCGAENPSNAKFCNQCGNELD
jgi:voltage-gated potassium channel